MIKVSVKTILYWDCPICGHSNEIEDREDKPTLDELECEKCSYEDTWELE